MSAEIKKEVQLEIAHVVFIDIVGSSKLSISDQHAAIEELNQVVRTSEQFQRAEAASRLLKIPTGDGMALVFYTSPEAPAQCAVEISRALKEHPRLHLRMGIHSGPVSGVVDVTERANLTGAGINVAKQVMDCGDAGHILVSKHVAEDLEEYEQWRPLLHDLGTCEMKHGLRVSVVNLYGDQFGNAKSPLKFETVQKRRARLRWAATTAALLALAAIVAGIVMFSRYRVGSAAPEKSIAVLPFQNLSADPENAFFTDGVQDEILSDLAKIADLKVISRTSAMQYKSGVKRNLREIANELGVAHVVEGSVQRAANRVRVSAQLIDARNDTHVWVEKYDRDLADVFAIQSEIAQKIANQLQAKLSPTEKSAMNERPTSDLVAYDLYLQAKELIYNSRFNPARQGRGLFKAVQLLDQAVTRDPAFLLAYCQLAYANDVIYFANHDHTETRLALAESSVEAAVRLQPDSGETHLAQASHFFLGYLNYRRAREELAKAQRELPNNAEVFRMSGQMNRWEGHWEEARQNLGRAVELDPRNARTITDLAFVYMALREYEEADVLATRLQALEPRSPILRAGRAFIGLEARADMASLRAVLNTVESESPQSATEVADLSFRLAVYERDSTKAANALANMPREGKIDLNGVPFPHTWYEGLLAKLRQDAAAARSAFTAARAETEKLANAQPQNVRPLAVLALIDAELGDKEKALREGRTACDMLPPTKDALDGVWLMTNLARIYALTGEKDLALEQLEAVNRLVSGPSYGELRLNPEWDLLRGDPRFEQIVASLAPKKP
jgi:TolB-like protein/class 3 adenylate cyclase/Flp pilus assembly protein TadD